MFFYRHNQLQSPDSDTDFEPAPYVPNRNQVNLVHFSGGEGRGGFRDGSRMDAKYAYPEDIFCDYFEGQWTFFVADCKNSKSLHNKLQNRTTRPTCVLFFLVAFQVVFVLSVLMVLHD
jgi:hypothetical protein